MSTHEAKIVVTSQVDGAVLGLKSVAGATNETTTAAKAAGAQQLELGKQVDNTKAKQLESRAAIEKVRVAQELHNATVKAFGPSSAQAAESQTKLTRAHDAAAKAAAEATTELEQLRLGLAKENETADKASPALAKVTKEVEKLGTTAEKQANDLKKLELATQGAGKGADKAGAGFDLLGMASSKAMAVLGPAALGATLISAAGWLADAADETLRYETAVNNLPFALDAAKAATHGLISEQVLATSASQALALGVVKTSAEFSQLAEDAAKIALKLGTSSEQMLGDLTTAIGRGSSAILDNAGILLRAEDAQAAYAASIGKTVDQLDDAQKKTAFQVAAMKAIRDSAAATTVGFDSNAAAVARLKVASEDTMAAFKRATANAVGAVVSSIDGATSSFESMSAQMELISHPKGPLGALEERMLAYANATQGATSTSLEFLGALTLSGEALARYEDAQGRGRLDKYKQTEAEQRAAYVDGQRREESELRDTYAKRDQFWAAQRAKEAADAKKHAKKSGPQAEMADPGDVARARIYDGRDDTRTIDRDAEEAGKLFLAAQDQALVDAEIARREETIASLNQEIEARAAANDDTQVLMDARAQAEDDLYDFQRRKQRDRERLREAETKHEKQQHERRIAQLKAAAAQEAVVLHRREQIASNVASTVGGLTETMVGAIEAQMEGEKHALAVGLDAYLKSIRNRMLAKGAEELALAAASAAMYNYPGAAQHGVAAGLAFAAAGAAQVGGMAVRGITSAATGKDWDSIKEENSESKSKKKKSEDTGTGDSSGSGSSRGQSDLEKQAVPVSYEETRRNSAVMSLKRSGVNLTVNVGNLMGRDEKAFGQYLAKVLRDSLPAGKRY